MDKRSRLKHEAHTRANDECAANHGVIDTTESGQMARAVLSSTVKDEDRHFAEQQRCLNTMDQAVDESRLRHRALRDVLRGVVKLSPFVKPTDGSAKVTLTPGRRSYELMLADGRTILDLVMANLDAFITAGMGRNVATDLQAQVEAFDAARNRRWQARRDYNAAMQAIEVALALGDRTIGQIEAILANSPDPGAAEALRKLRIAKRIGPRATDEAPEATAPVPDPAAKTA